MKVDLPDPDAPLIATNSPGDTSNETPRSACTDVCPRWYVLCKLCTTMSGFPWLSALTTRGAVTSAGDDLAIPAEAVFFSTSLSIFAITVFFSFTSSIQEVRACRDCFDGEGTSRFPLHQNS